MPVNLGRHYLGSNCGVTYSAYKSECTKLFEPETSVKRVSLQKLILKSRAARLLAIRQVTQLNAGKKTAGIDGKASLSFEERRGLSDELKRHSNNWFHQKLREIPIPKKDGKTRILKVPTIADRAWQCLAKYALEPDSRCNFPCQELWL